MISRMPVWLTVLILILVFFPFYYLNDSRDAVDIMSSMSAVAPLVVIFIYSPSYRNILFQKNKDLNDNQQYLLLGILLVAIQTVGSRAFGLWFRMRGNNDPSWFFGIVPAFLAYLAFLGYLLHIVAPQPPADEHGRISKISKYRVVITIIVGGVIGLIFAFNN